jgi:2-(1,2-epoxy-1,2-dihydrophenyl)acetyl-CoA isomerase
VGHDRNTGSSELLSHLDGGVLSLTLNRPEAETSADVRCVVLKGAAEAFCAGGDVKRMGAGTLDENALIARIRWQTRVQRETAGRLHTMPKPTLAVINGPAAGAGLSLALACDLRLMVDSTVLLTAFASVGLSGDFGAAYFLTRLAGTARARELLFLSDRVSAAQALEYGLANWLCPPKSLAERASAIAARLASGPALALGFMKDNLNRAVASPMYECMDIEADHHIHCTATADHREGVAAFAEKRVARFGARS